MGIEKCFRSVGKVGDGERSVEFEAVFFRGERWLTPVQIKIYYILRNFQAALKIDIVESEKRCVTARTTGTATLNIKVDSLRMDITEGAVVMERNINVELGAMRQVREILCHRKCEC